MNVIDLFRRLVFAQVLLGIVSFCMAERNPGMLLVAGAIAALSWYVAEGPTGKPLPRWLINMASVSAVAWLLFDLYWQRGDVIVAMGHFTMWLQIVLLYDEKSSKVYGQILVLSLLQMIGASVLSVSIVFGILLGGYCLLSLFTVLLFQIKMTNDMVLDSNKIAAPMGAAVGRPEAVLGRGFRWQFRSTAVIVGVLCATVAGLVFVLLPRTSRFQNTHDFSGNQHKQVGFTPSIQLSGVPPAPGSREPMMNMTIKLHKENVGSEQRSYLVRGAVCDEYAPLNHQWSRGRWITTRDMPSDMNGQVKEFTKTEPETTMLEVVITLCASNPHNLFTLYPPASIHSTNLPAVVFNPDDQQLQTNGAINGPIAYTLRVPLHTPATFFDGYKKTFDRKSENLSGAYIPPVGSEEANYARGWPSADQEVKLRKLAMDILNKEKITRKISEVHDPNDEQIVYLLTEHLRTNYRYSLTNPSPKGLDEPILDFLMVNRQGHCELFASALVALTRSIGMRARVVTGFMACEFNRLGGYYVIRQSDAHAWAEVELPEGWRAFDPTPPAEVVREHRVERRWYTFLREVYEHIEFVWIGTIVAYDKETREQVLTTMTQEVEKAANDPDTILGKFIATFSEMLDWWRFDTLSYSVAMFIVVFIFIGVASLFQMAVVRRRRIIALQLTRLPSAQRRELSRRLGFYLQMLDLLDRHGYHRPSWQSPFGFAQELAEAYPMRFDPVVALTEMFYEIRFGHRQLDSQRRAHVRAHLKQLEENLSEESR